MAMTPEGKVKDQVKTCFRHMKQELGMEIYHHMPVQNGMGAPTLDFIVCIPRVITQDMVGQRIGEFHAIETKAPGGKPTERQLMTIADIEAAGGRVHVYDGSRRDEFAAWLLRQS